MNKAINLNQDARLLATLISENKTLDIDALTILIGDFAMEKIHSVTEEKQPHLLTIEELDQKCEELNSKLEAHLSEIRRRKG